MKRCLLMPGLLIVLLAACEEVPATPGSVQSQAVGAQNDSDGDGWADNNWKDPSWNDAGATGAEAGADTPASGRLSPGTGWNDAGVTRNQAPSQDTSQDTSQDSGQDTSQDDSQDSWAE